MTDPQASDPVRIPEDDPALGLCWHHGHIDEDVLTGHVFSALRYVRTAREKFLRHLCEVNPIDHQILRICEEVRFDPWPGWEVPKEFREVFPNMESKSRHQSSGKEKGAIEPDVVIQGDGWRLLVEAEESKEYEPVQLIQQYVLSRTSYIDRNRQTFQLLVAPTLGRPSKLNDDILKAWNGHALEQCEGGSPDDLVKHLLWIGWEEIEGVLIDCAHQAPDPEKLILLDTCRLLRKKGYARVKSPRRGLEECRGLAKALQDLLTKIKAADNFPKHILEEILQARSTVEALTQSLRFAECHNGWA